MGLEVQKQNRENSQGLVRRFARAVQQSGILVRARKLRFKTRKKSRQMIKKSALRRGEKRKEYDKLKKLGQNVKK
ncbi:MAG: hypothetical protein V1705_02275 [bacterium]